MSGSGRTPRCPGWYKIGLGPSARRRGPSKRDTRQSKSRPGWSKRGPGMTA